MATGTATAPAKGTEDAAPTLHAFVLDDEALAVLEPKGGRKPKPSVYLNELKDAVASGKAMGIAVTATVKAPYIMGQLRKGAKNLDIKIKIWDRSDRIESPFVGFQVQPASAAAGTVPVETTSTN